MSKKVCFIGHREIRLIDISEKLKEAIENEIINGYRHFIMGSHGNFDNFCLNACRKLRKKYPDIEIEVILTSRKQLETFYIDKESGIETYSPYKDVKTFLYEIDDVYFKRQITESNQKMINECDTLICYVNKKKTYSGAKYAYNYAKRKGLRIVNLYDESKEPTYGMIHKQVTEQFNKILAKYKKKK